jgi:uncharacterized repeat protein (TIGR03803 family)
MTEQMARVGILAVGVLSWLATLTGCGGGSSSDSPSPPPPVTTFTVGGTVSGLQPAQSVTLQNNGGNPLIVAGNGAFAFSVRQDAGSAYDVTVRSRSPGIKCSVNNGSGVVAASNVTSVSVSCTAGTFTILHDFGTDRTQGASPQGTLVMDEAGNLYGTTAVGGMLEIGTVYKIDADGNLSVLHSFRGHPTDGAGPGAGLIMDGTGNLYGTTIFGGEHQQGTIYRISAAGDQSILHSFSGPDGRYPRGALLMDGEGNLYGTASDGGARCCGTVFKLGADGTMSVLHSFARDWLDGGDPQAELTMDSHGNLFGTTATGGLGGSDFGTVFKISADGTASVFYSFSGFDGVGPHAGVVIDRLGNLYGTTTGAGGGGWTSSGAVFRITPLGIGTVLHYFIGGFTPEIIDGGYPSAELLLDSNTGNLYGTTVRGGDHDFGTVFEISTSGTLNILHSFTGRERGGGNSPYGGLILDSAGNLYGTTAVGGTDDGGIVFKIH